MLDADRRAEQAELLHLPDDVFRPDVVVLEAMDVRCDVALEKAVDRVQDHPLVVGRLVKVHVEKSLIGRRPHGRAWGSASLRTKLMHRVPSALRPRVATVTMPCVGRDFDSRFSSTSLSA